MLPLVLEFCWYPRLLKHNIRGYLCSRLFCHRRSLILLCYSATERNVSLFSKIYLCSSCIPDFLKFNKCWSRKWILFKISCHSWFWFLSTVKLFIKLSPKAHNDSLTSCAYKHLLQSACLYKNIFVNPANSYFLWCFLNLRYPMTLKMPCLRGISYYLIKQHCTFGYIYYKQGNVRPVLFSLLSPSLSVGELRLGKLFSFIFLLTQRCLREFKTERKRQQV